MIGTRRFLSLCTLVVMLVMVIASPAHAFDGRSGDVVVIEADEVIDDDLYVTAEEFVLDGTVNGDLIAAGRTITINGTVDGDVMAAGQTIVVNGTVTGAVRMAGSILFVEETANIEGDIIAAGYSLETKAASAVGQDVVFAGGQFLLAGDVARNVHAATGAFELRGAVGGDVQADVAEADSDYSGPPPGMFMPPSTVGAPTVKPGFTLDPSARIEGNLEYTQTRELALPAGVVAGTIKRNEPAAGTAAPQETTADRVQQWGFDALRTSLTLILIGLFLLWLFPSFMQSLSTRLQTAFWPSLGWGVVVFAGFFLLLFFIIVAMILGGLLFGVLTLGGLAGSIVWLGILAAFALILGFVLFTSFVAKIAFGQALGRWLLMRTNSPLAAHQFWPMVIGVLITVLVIALLSFPLLPGVLGGLLNILVVLFGLGALWLWAREQRTGRTVTT